MSAPPTIPPISTAFVVIVKRAFKPLFDEHDEVPISNLGAIRLGLEARVKEDASDKTRADELWTAAIRLLQQEEENTLGVAGSIQVEDDFEMQGVGGEMDYWGGGYYWGRRP